MINKLLEKRRLLSLKKKLLQLNEKKVIDLNLERKLRRKVCKIEGHRLEGKEKLFLCKECGSLVFDSLIREKDVISKTMTIRR